MPRMLALCKSASPGNAKRQEPWSMLAWEDPTENLPPRRLSRTQQAPKGSAITSILHPQHWLNSDEIDFASHLLAREHNDIDGFQSCLLFSVLERGGIVGTPTRQFVQILHTGETTG